MTICDDLIDFFEAHPEHRFSGTAGDKLDENFKKSTEITFADLSANLKNRYYSLLSEVAKNYMSYYRFSDTAVGPWGLYGEPKIQKYQPGEGFYGWHCERTSSDPNYSRRHLVFMTYLNDVLDQGETEFFYQQLKIQPRKGMTLIWPADWTHTHRGVTSPSQTKYIATGWYGFF